MSVVDHLVDDFVDEHKVLADALLIEHATVVTEDLHHAIDDVQDGAWSNICLTCCNKVDAKLLCKEVIDTVHVLNNHTNWVSKALDRIDNSELVKASCLVSITILTNVGGGSPGQNLTFLKKISLVCLFMSKRTIKDNHFSYFSNIRMRIGNKLTITLYDRVSPCR